MFFLAKYTTDRDALLFRGNYTNYVREASLFVLEVNLVENNHPSNITTTVYYFYVGHNIIKSKQYNWEDQDVRFLYYNEKL